MRGEDLDADKTLPLPVTVDVLNAEEAEVVDVADMNVVAGQYH